MEASEEAVKEKCMELYKEVKRKVKRCIYQIKNEVNDSFKDLSLLNHSFRDLCHWTSN